MHSSQDMLFTRFAPRAELEEPILAELFSVERLEQHGAAVEQPSLLDDGAVGGHHREHRLAGSIRRWAEQRRAYRAGAQRAGDDLRLRRVRHHVAVAPERLAIVARAVVDHRRRQRRQHLRGRRRRPRRHQVALLGH